MATKKPSIHSLGGKALVAKRGAKYMSELGKKGAKASNKLQALKRKTTNKRKAK